MAVGDVSWTLTACIALSLPPVLLLLLVKSSKRSDIVRGSAPISSCYQPTADVTSHSSRNSITTRTRTRRYRARSKVHATLRFAPGGRLFQGKAAPYTRSTATLCVFVYALNFIGVSAFGTGSFMTVRKSVAKAQVDGNSQRYEYVFSCFHVYMFTLSGACLPVIFPFKVIRFTAPAGDGSCSSCCSGV